MTPNRSLAVALLLLSAIGGFGCNAQAVLTRQVEARQLASELEVQFTKAADASNRSVMSDADDVATAAAREADMSAQETQRTSERLREVLRSMGYSEEIAFLDGFDSRFAEYRKLDAEINNEIVMLSRRDSGVHSLALTLGRKRTVAALCQDQIRGLRETLAKHEMSATR